MKKLLLVFLCLFSGFCLFAEQWYICLGSFREINYANQLLKTLQDNSFPAVIQETKNNDNETFYKVVLDEPFETRAAAMARRDEVKKIPIIKELKINGMWCWDMPDSTPASGTETVQKVISEPVKVISEIENETEIEIEVDEDPEEEIEIDYDEIFGTESDETAASPEEEYIIDYEAIFGSEAAAQITASVVEHTEVSVPAKYETRYIYITDSDNGLPVDNANVNIDSTWERWTDFEGKASLPEEITDGEHTMVVTRGDEYVPTTGSFSLSNGEITTVNQVAIPKAVDYDRVKVILNWGEYPSDLDSHVFTPEYHVYYSHMNDGGINLDHDDTTSWGPETITIRSPDPSKKYEYYIHNFTYRDEPYSTSLSNSEASVKLYMNNEYIKTYTITPDIQGLAWHVFDIVNGSEIVDVNEIVTSDHHF